MVLRKNKVASQDLYIKLSSNCLSILFAILCSILAIIDA